MAPKRVLGAGGSMLSINNNNDTAGAVTNGFTESDQTLLEGDATPQTTHSTTEMSCPDFGVSLQLPLNLAQYSRVMQENDQEMPHRIKTEISPCSAGRLSQSSSLSSRSRIKQRSWMLAGCALLVIGFVIRITTSRSCPGVCPAFYWVPMNVRGRLARFGISSYLNLYNHHHDDNVVSSEITEDEAIRPTSRTLGDGTSGVFHFGSNAGPNLVVAGKMLVEGEVCNIAQFNLQSRKWSLSQRIQLSLYNSYSGGEVYFLLSNHTEKVSSINKNEQGSGELIVVGAFDTTYRNSQVTYCSVGKWDGISLTKVGEGLCNSALSKGMKITTAAFAGPQDVYVAGSFHTQVWNGDRHEFVKIFNIAHFNAADQVWLPLNVGQITCSWCTVTVLALAWDSKREQLHVAGKFDAIDGANVPAGLAIYDHKSGHLVAHPGGGLTMRNITQDGVGTALQIDEESGVLYVMGSFERLTDTYEICLGLAAYEIEANRWTCLANAAHTVWPTGGGNMLLTPYGLMVAGQTTNSTTWPDSSRPYTIALLTTTLRKKKATTTKVISDDDDVEVPANDTVRDFDWSWLPGFVGHDEPLHALSNGFSEYEGSVFIAGDNLVAMWTHPKGPAGGDDGKTVIARGTSSTFSNTPPQTKPHTIVFSDENQIVGAIMAISQMMPDTVDNGPGSSASNINYKIIIYCVALGTCIGIFIAIAFNKKMTSTIVSVFSKDGPMQGIPLDTLSYSAIEDSSITEAYERAMRTRHVQQPSPLTLINSQEIYLLRKIGEGTFGRVWSAKWGTSTVAVKEFVLAQAAVAGKSMDSQKIVDSIVGEAGMMAILRHPNVLQLFGCTLTAQAIWIVSELCNLGSLRQLLDDQERALPTRLRLSLALQVAEGIAYLHKQNPPIIHRDLKSHNILVHETFTGAEESTSPKSSKKKETSPSEKRDEDSSSPKPTIVAKIGDWGSARASLSGGGSGTRSMTHGVGTACWMAPETIKRGRSSKRSDAYSYGIVLWELWTRLEVYDGMGGPQIIHQVANESLRPPVPQDCPWVDLMVRCWSEQPKDRPDFDEIVQQLLLLMENDFPDDEASPAGQTAVKG